MRVLCVAAHPDDEILGVGGTLLRHAESDDVLIYLAHPCVRPESVGESHEAERIMGIPYIRFEPSIAEVVRDFEPDIVYTHHPGDLHHEHRSVHEAVLIACRPYTSRVRSLRTFETPSATDWGIAPFTARLFVDIGSRLDAKLAAMESYTSELLQPPHPRSLSELRTRAAYWGQQAGVRYAEAFDIIREVI